MFATERQQQILAQLRTDGTVRTRVLAGQFRVAEETIRRDLEQLARHGLVARTHGGGLDPSRKPLELAQSERERRNVSEKRHIARAAAKWIQPDETILLDASSTALELTAFLPEKIRLATYSLAIVDRLSTRTDLELILLGGQFEPRGRRVSGLLTESALRSLQIDRFFFSGGGFDPQRGVADPNASQASIKRLAIELANWSCALLDHSKIGLDADWFFAAPDQFDHLITNAPVSTCPPAKETTKVFTLETTQASTQS